MPHEWRSNSGAPSASEVVQEFGRGRLRERDSAARRGLMRVERDHEREVLRVPGLEPAIAGGGRRLRHSLGYHDFGKRFTLSLCCIDNGSTACRPRTCGLEEERERENPDPDRRGVCRTHPWQPATAQDAYPTRPVKILVGANAGGGTDIIARMLAEKFQDSMKQAFVVENRPGASNTIAADLVAKAPQDGHTLLVATNTGQAIAPHLIKLGFDPLKQLQPVGLVVVVPNVLVVGSVTPYTSVKDLVAAAKAKPGDIKYASSGVGSTQHIAGEAFDLAAGVKTTHIPYKGSSQAHIDLLSGEVQMMFDTTSSAMAQIKAGKFRPLAVTSTARSAELPNVPTIAEVGYPAAELTTWYGLFVTGGTPKAIVDQLHAELQKALALPDVQARLRGLGGEPGKLSIEQFAKMNRDEYDRFGKLIKTANIRVD
jgi:tripartite-type tricarboxylate transporter receptor subunit TctC